jgi:Carbohydrate esterase, sialic acid-specific acetylesterase
MMRRLIQVSFVVAVFACGYVFGVISHRYETFPYYYVKGIVDGDAFETLAQHAGYDVTWGRTMVRCNALPNRSLVLLTLGQSNAANSGEGRSAASARVYNFNLFDGRCYEARDPLLGASGDGAAPWIALAAQLIEHDLTDAVVIAPIAVGGSRIRDWSTGGTLAPRIDRTLAGLDSAGLDVSALLWHQGESNRGTDSREYTEAFLQIVRKIRARGMTVPIYVAQATRCGDRVDEGIRLAQSQLAKVEDGIRPGPDTDVLTGPQLRNGCHFTQQGTQRHAELWFETLRPDVPQLLSRRSYG